MKIYIEYVILDNFIVDYLLLTITECTLKNKYKKSLKILSCLIGVITAIFLPFLYKYKIIIFIYKILSVALMILILQKYNSYRRYFKTLFLFITYTFVFGGLLIGVFNMFNIKYTTSGILLYNYEIPISLFVFILCCGGWLLKKVVSALNKQVKISRSLYPISLQDGDNIVSGVGYYDSGNNIQKDGVSVSIISLDMFMKLHKDFPIEKLLFNNVKNTNLKNADFIDVKTVNSVSKYLSFQIDKMIVEDIVIEKPVLAVVLKNFDNFDCIMNLKMLKE